MINGSSRSAPSRIAFLLSQVGSCSAQQFAKLLAPLKLSPADAGVLRLLKRSEGISQQNLARALNMHASRLVALIDALETRGLLVREPNATDRRLHSLKLTPRGNEVMSSIGDLARQHNDLMSAGLSSAERSQLEALLQKIADRQGLVPGIHPGYKELGKRSRRGAPK